MMLISLVLISLVLIAWLGVCLSEARQCKDAITRALTLNTGNQTGYATRSTGSDRNIKSWHHDGSNLNM
jgi:hypothetical protein